VHVRLGIEPGCKGAGQESTRPAHRGDVEAVDAEFYQEPCCVVGEVGVSGGRVDVHEWQGRRQGKGAQSTIQSPGAWNLPWCRQAWIAAGCVEFRDKRSWWPESGEGFRIRTLRRCGGIQNASSGNSEPVAAAIQCGVDGVDPGELEGWVLTLDSP